MVAESVQSGNNNLSTISQTNNLVDGDSSANGAFASQSGNYNNSLIVQNGAGNEAVLAQAGNYNVSVIDQAGSDHVANVAQYSNGNVSGVYQTGVANSATVVRSEEHTSELQSLMRISYAVFCLNK